MLSQHRHRLPTWLLAWTCAGCWVLAAPNAGCGGWESMLEDGRQISVDPSSNRAIIQSGAGAGSPLWDGVHVMQDGSTITIRSGLMVPNEEVMSLRGTEPPATRSVPALDPVCDDLVVKTCGLTTECGEEEACNLARQLRASQWQAARQGRDGIDWSTSHCQSALTDEKTFPACAAARPLIAAPCRRVVALLCGSSERCAASKACELSRQLLALEEKRHVDIGEELSATPQRQCQDLLIQHATFPPCR